MRFVTSCAIVAAVGAIAFASAAAAADVPVPQGPPEYYGDAPADEGYVYQRPPAVYGYPQQPPPAYYYEYGPPAVAVVPGPYYLRRHYVYGGPPYRVRGYAPYVARGSAIGHYGNRGHNRW